MPVLDYSKLSRVQKMAVFLIVIGQDSAANIVRTFADGELESVCREMAKLPVISDEIRMEALDEFSALVDVGFGSALGGTSYVRGTLELARGEHRAAYLLERVAPAAGGDGGGASLPQFEGMDTRQVFSLLRGEQPQTVAFLLSQLDFAKAGEILRMLDPEQRAEVIERLGEMDSTSPEVVRRIAQQFNKRAAPEKPTAPVVAHNSGGAPFVANLLKTLDKETSRSLLAVLQDRNAALSDTIRKKLFSFDDMAALTNADIQKIMREVESADLSAALKGPRGETMLKKVMASMSKRAAEGLQEEIQMMAPVRPKDQEAAQDRILAVVRKLEEQGEISLDQGTSPMRLEAIRLEHPLRDIRLVIDGLVPRTPEEDAAQARAAELERMATAISTARETGYRQGRADADASFTEQLMTQRQEVLELAEGVLRTLADQHTSLATQARACVPGLVMNIVRRVLAGGEPDGAQIQKIIKQALAETPQAGEQPLEVFLCPSDLAQLETMGGDTLREKHPRVSLRPDVSLSPRDCLVRGNFGLIDGRMETKLRAVEKLLATH